MNSRGIAAGLDLPNSEAFELFVDLNLTTKEINKTKAIFDIKNDIENCLWPAPLPCKKVEHICREIFARLIMYNFTEASVS